MILTGKKRSLATILLTLLGSGAMAASSGPNRDVLERTIDFTLTGKVSFNAEYETTSKGPIPDGTGLIPHGRSDMPGLYLCAYDADSVQDFEFFGAPTDDDLLGCERTGMNGLYTIPVNGWRTSSVVGADGAPDLYLVTWYCDAEDSGATSDAAVCVRLNGPENDAAAPKHRKYSWSRTYDDLTVADGDRVVINWHLSCPDEDGLARAVHCATLEPSGNSGSSNSNFGFNKEAAHVFRAAVQPILRFDSMKPSAGNTATYLCTDDACSNEIRLHLRDAQPGPFPYTTDCDATEASQNFASSCDEICISTPLNPFRVVHEIGHVAHLRWMVWNRGLFPAECGWTHGTSAKCSAAEGWADFLGTAAWYSRGTTDPTYDGLAMEDPFDPDLYACGAVDFGEGRDAQFFWDVFDRVQHACETDEASVPLVKMRRVWSRFGPGEDNRQSGEEDEAGGSATDHGRNVKDWLWHFGHEVGDAGGRVSALISSNCLDHLND